jgi:hypothetical protein
MRVNKLKSNQVARKNLLGKRRWSRSSAGISAATARAGCRSLCAERATALVGIAYAGPYVAEGCTRCNPRLLLHAPRTRRMGCAAPQTDYSTSPNLLTLTMSGSAASPTCRWLRRLGLSVCVPRPGQQAGSRLARHGHNARGTDSYRLVARFFGPAAHARPTRPL